MAAWSHLLAHYSVYINGKVAIHFQFYFPLNVRSDFGHSLFCTFVCINISQLINHSAITGWAHLGRLHSSFPAVAFLLRLNKWCIQNIKRLKVSSAIFWPTSDAVATHQLEADASAGLSAATATATAAAAAVAHERHSRDKKNYSFLPATKGKLPPGCLSAEPVT